MENHFLFESKGTMTKCDLDEKSGIKVGAFVGDPNVKAKSQVHSLLPFPAQEAAPLGTGRCAEGAP